MTRSQPASAIPLSTARVQQSQRLLRDGQGFWAIRAARLARILCTNETTIRNYEIVNATVRSWSDLSSNTTAPIVQPMGWAERLELLYALEHERIRRARRIRMACLLVIIAVMIRWAFGRPLPMKALFTGFVYQNEGGTFTFVFSHGFGWLLLSLLWNYMMRPAVVREEEEAR